MELCLKSGTRDGGSNSEPRRARLAHHGSCNKRAPVAYIVAFRLQGNIPVPATKNLSVNRNGLSPTDQRGSKREKRDVTGLGFFEAD